MKKNKPINLGMLLGLEEQQNYIHLVKNKCVGCGQPIPKVWENYKKFGNYCWNCNHLANLKLKIEI